MKKGLFPFFILLAACVLLFGGIFLFKKPATTSTASFADMTIGDSTYRVELARTDAELEQGLSGRDAIGSDGMLFEFSKNQYVTFWMKDMRFALDMVWILNNTIVGIDRNVEPPLNGHDLEVRRSSGLISSVLEVKAGDAKDMFVGENVSVRY